MNNKKGAVKLTAPRWRSGQGLNLLGTCNGMYFPPFADHSVRAAYHRQNVCQREPLPNIHKIHNCNECLNQGHEE